VIAGELTCRFRQAFTGAGSALTGYLMTGQPIPALSRCLHAGSRTLLRVL